MRPRSRHWYFALTLLSGALLAGCGDDPAPVTPGDARVDVSPDTGAEDAGEDAGEDAASDAKTPPDVADVPTKDAPPDVAPPEDVPGDTGDDATPTEDVPAADVPPAEDVPAADVPPAEDVPAADVPPAEDVPAPDVPPAEDVPGVDVPAVDTPAVDTPAVDAPAVDAPAVDVPTLDTPVADVRPDAALDVAPDVAPDVRPDAAPDVTPTGCTLPTQRALALPTDRATGTTSGASRIAATSCVASGGPEHIYPLRVAARTGVVLSTEGSAYDTVLAIRRVCDAQASEVACNDDTPAGTAAYLRRVLEPGDYYVVVDQYGPAGGTGGAYTLTLSSFTPAANADCAAAATLTPGSVSTGATTGGVASSTACVNDQWGPQLFYALTIPAGQRATVTATPTGTPAWRAVVRALTACASTTCLANGASAAPGGAATAVVDNRGLAPLRVVVSVASSAATAGGAFTLTAALTTLSTPPANATCAAARLVGDGAVLTGENPSLGTARLNNVCVPGAQGTALFYRVSVPSRATLVFSATPTAGWDLVLRALTGCAATACAASTDVAGNGGAETLRWSNTGAVSQDVYVAVSSFSATVGGTFNGTVRILPPPTNDFCVRATPVTSGASLTDQNAALGTGNLTGPCLPGATGTVLYYSIRVPAGQQLTVNARPAAGVDAVVRLLDACGAPACLASANARAADGAEQILYVNATRADRTLVVAVGGASNATNGRFDVDFNVRREYVESLVPRACDDVTGGARLTGLTADDSSSPILDLPFAFSFYGERELEYSVSSNGLVQLWPSLAGTPSTAFDNQPIPTAAAPGRFIAAFWDDLLPATGSGVVVRTLGVAPNRRFVIQWTGFSVVGDARASLTFQTKLFEGSNAVELHYCTLTPGAAPGRVTGESATVGVESLDGSAGRQHSFNAAAAVSTTQGLRFTF